MRRIAIVWLGLTMGVAAGCYNAFQPMPDGTAFEGRSRPVSEVGFLRDLTWVDAEGTRHVDQQIFDEVFRIIGGAENILLVDMFLYNDFQGEHPETTRALAEELTSNLIRRKQERPDLIAVLITDPINIVYGGVRSKHLDALEEAGIEVVITDLDALRDSNPGYSWLWRAIARPFGTRGVGVFPSPFGDGRVTLRSYLALLNFKANHRKVVVADDRDGVFHGLVTSANPHDGSSAHGNVAVRFQGRPALDLLESEYAVIRFSHGKIPDFGLEGVEIPRPDSPLSLRIVTEEKIRDALIKGLDALEADDAADVAVFYLSDHGVIDAMVEAHQRGAAVRVLLDPNKDAFGYEKNGIPNRPVAAYLREEGIDVRWCDTHGEQCHAKMLLTRSTDGEALLVAGSANFTRRNLQNYNLETSVAVRGPAEADVFASAARYFDLIWTNDDGRSFSTDYETHGDPPITRDLLYKIEETSGMSTF